MCSQARHAARHQNICCSHTRQCSWPQGSRPALHQLQHRRPAHGQVQRCGVCSDCRDVIDAPAAVKPATKRPSGDAASCSTGPVVRPWSTAASASTTQMLSPAASSTCAGGSFPSHVSPHQRAPWLLSADAPASNTQTLSLAAASTCAVGSLVSLLALCTTKDLRAPRLLGAWVQMHPHQAYSCCPSSRHPPSNQAFWCGWCAINSSPPVEASCLDRQPLHTRTASPVQTDIRSG